MNSRNRRRRYYVDDMLQGRLLGWLLGVEIVLVLALLAVLHARMDAVIDAQIYRSHFATPPSIGALLAPSIAGAVATLLALNCAVVLLLERAWSRRVHGIVERFRELTRRTQQLDLGADDDLRHEHQAVAGMLRWREEFRSRMVRGWAAAARLDPDVARNDPAALTRQREAVAAIQDAFAR